jgi:hypothetical protein
MSSKKSSHYWRARGGARGSNSKTTAPNLEPSSSRGPTTSPLDTSSTPNSADSPRQSESDTTDLPITPSLGVIGAHESVQHPTDEHESVEHLISKLTTPTPLSTTDNNPYPVGFAPIDESQDIRMEDEFEGPLTYDEDIRPVIEPVRINPPFTRPMVPPSVKPRAPQRPKARPKQDRRVSEQQSGVNSAETAAVVQLHLRRDLQHVGSWSNLYGCPHHTIHRPYP